MKATFMGIASIDLEFTPGCKTSKLIGVSIDFEGGQNTDMSFYKNEDDLPTAEGYKIMTQIFVQALNANIQLSHQLGYRDSAEHLQYILKELERSFIQVCSVEKVISPFKNLYNNNHG